jgi:type I restriction enzyme, S subunit
MREPWGQQRLRDLIEKPVPGFWGEDAPGHGLGPARVVRNGDAATQYIISVHDLPRRWLNAREIAKAECRAGDILLTSSGEVGAVAALKNTSGERVVASNFTRRIRARPGTDSSWLFFLLQGRQAQAIARKSSGGTTLQNLSSRFFDDFIVPTPPLEEQRSIGRVLDTIDDAIRSADELVAKLRETRLALLHELLAFGVHDAGELRRARTGNEGFAATELGRLPRAWTVQPIGDLLADVKPAMRSGPFGSALLKSELVHEGVPMLGIDNVEVEQFVAKYTRFVSPEKFRQLARYAVRPRDVMVTIMGTVGRCCVVPGNIGQALSSKHVWTLTFDTRKYLPELACMQINYGDWVLRHFARDAQGGIMSAIRSETLRTTLLPVPPLPEQQRIFDILSTQQARITAVQRTSAKLRILKAGLLNDLLIGRVRTSGTP